MSKNIVALITDEFGGSVIDAARNMTGLGADDADRSVRAAVPAMLSGILGATASQAGKDALEAALSSQGNVDDLPSLMTSDRREQVAGSGWQSLSSVLGEGQLDKLAGAVGNYAGLSDVSIRSIIGLLSPVVLGVLGRQQRLGNMSVSGVVDMLAQQRTAIEGALPVSLAKSLRSMGLLGDRLDRGDLAERGDEQRAASRSAERTRRAVPANTAAAASSTRRPERSGAPWLLGIGGLALLVGLGWALTRGAGDAGRDVADRAEQIAAAPQFRVGEIDVAAEFRTVTDGLTRSLRTVTNDATARTALPQVMTLSEQIDRLGPLAERLSPDSKPVLADTLRQSMTGVRAEVERVASLPDVPDEMQQAVGTVRTKLEALVSALSTPRRG